MDTHDPTPRTQAAPRGPARILVALSLAALVAMLALSPDDAGAMRMSQYTAIQRCAGAGGTMYFDFEETSYGNPKDAGMTCTLPSGNTFSCERAVSETYRFEWMECHQ